MENLNKYFTLYRHNNFFLISQPKHLLWVLKRTVIEAVFLSTKNTLSKLMGKKIFTLKNCVYLKPVTARTSSQSRSAILLFIWFTGFNVLVKNLSGCWLYTVFKSRYIILK